MSEPKPTQNAARLSEDIGDVLSAIRRMIAEDEAQADGYGRHDRANDTDAGDFLARRHGGNAALARRLAGTESATATPYGHPRGPAEDLARGRDDDWPLGPFANSPAAARPLAGVSPDLPSAPNVSPARRSAGLRIMRHDGVDATKDAADDRSQPRPQNDLARSLSADLRLADPVERAGSIDNPDPGIEASAVTPLRLDAARRVAAEPESVSTASAVSEGEAASRVSSGWRSWIRPEPPLQRRAAQFKPTTIAPQPVSVSDGEGEFMEAYDWKARMRPDIEPPTTTLSQAAPAAAPFQRRWSWLESREERADAATLGLPGVGVAADAAEPGFDEVFEALDRAVPTAEPRLRVAAAEKASPAAAAAVQPAEHDLPPAVEPARAALPAQPPASLRQPEIAAAHETVTGMSPEEEDESIRELLREMIREELHGELGERFSRNLRAVIRREVSAAIEDFLDRV